jgi:hypothetical protein
MKIINPDNAYEAAMRSECLPMNRQSLMDQYSPIRTEYLAAKNLGDSATMEKLAPEYNRLRSILSRNMVLFSKARSQAKKERNQCCLNQENFLADGTGGNYKEIEKQVIELRTAGYDCAMLYVHVPLDLSIERNRLRGIPSATNATPGRALTKREVKRSWNAVNSNRKKYESLFGSSFFLIENAEDGFENFSKVATSINSFLSS